ncbi:MAG TPA: Clp protease N-terminal domain-containing protein [Acidobacteriota bacterium]|nr:Clp protease N-terminal domain-containing protein [Acidobacteriota bacterium]
MFDTFSDKARRAIFFAQYEAKTLGAGAIEPDHILLGLLKEGGDLFERLVTTPPGISDLIKSKLLELLPQKNQPEPSEALPLSVKSQAVLRRAEKERKHLNQKQVEPGHLILALIEIEASSALFDIFFGKKPVPRATQLLKVLGFEPDMIRTHLVQSGVSQSEAEFGTGEPHGLKIKEWEKIWRQTVNRGAVGIFALHRPRPTFFIEGPVTHFNEIEQTELALGRPLPDSLRSFFLEHSKHIDISWQFPGKVPESFPNWGRCNLSLPKTVELFGIYQKWISVCFSDPENEYDLIWHNKFPIQEVGNGDLLTIELNEENQGSIVYLSHDGCDSHGWVLAPDLVSFLNVWGALGFPGPESWEMEQLIGGLEGYLDLNSKEAKSWLTWLGEPDRK